MTAKELHEQKIIPLRQELNRLEKECRDLYRKECSEKAGKRASCENCGYSDPNETREWRLNDRICDKIESALMAYEGCEDCSAFYESNYKFCPYCGHRLEDTHD